MCGIAGIVSADETDETGSLLKRMLEVMLHRGPDGAGFVIGGDLERKLKFEDLNFEEKRGKVAMGHVRLAITGGKSGLQPFQSKDKRLALLHNGEIYNYRELRKEVPAGTELATESDSEVIIKLIEKYYTGDLLTAVKRVLPKLDGVYALAITDNKQTVIARDKIGVKQLYLAECSDHVAFASEKKSLLAISTPYHSIKRLLPGHLAVMNEEGVRDFPFWSPESIRPSVYITDKEEALQAYDDAVMDSVAKRVAGRKRVGIIFSGGIDSVLISFLVRKLGIPFTCYTAGREGAVDIEWAQNAASRFEFPLEIRRLSLNEIEELIPEVISSIEDHSLNQVEVSIPMYASVRMAQEAGERVILTGQGADELFGGYPWYSRIVEQEGYQSFEERLWEDTFLLYKECLEREDKIAMAHSLELRVPYLDPQMIKLAFSISPHLKIGRNDDVLLKWIHRQYGLSIGVPEETAFRKKEAAQHGANVHTVFEELANKSGITETVLQQAGYDLHKSVVEKLGSSSRYGFRYGDHDLWKPLLCVQYYLDSQAAKLNLLPPESQQHWEQVTDELRAASVLEEGH
jgi:asparagine synthase (glutamine-hydrolysing)